MACEVQSFPGVTQDRFDALVEKARASGIALNGLEGSAVKDGITIRWLYDPAAETLELQCTDSPFFIPCAVVEAKIRELVGAS